MLARKWIKGCLAVASLTVASAASAAPEGAGFYFGVSGGESKYDEDGGDTDNVVRQSFADAGQPVSIVRSGLDDSDNNFAIFAGYRFNRYIAAEGGYVDLGELDYRADVTTLGLPQRPGTIRLKFSSRGVLAGAVGTLPINNVWEVYGRAAFFVSDTEVEATAQILNVTAPVNESKASLDSMLGLGTAVNLGRHVSIRLEYQRFGAVGDEDTTGETNVDLVNLGVVFRFPVAR